MNVSWRKDAKKAPTLIVVRRRGVHNNHEMVEEEKVSYLLCIVILTYTKHMHMKVATRCCPFTTLTCLFYILYIPNSQGCHSHLLLYVIGKKKKYLPKKNKNAGVVLIYCGLSVFQSQLWDETQQQQTTTTASTADEGICAYLTEDKRVQNVLQMKRCTISRVKHRHYFLSEFERMPTYHHTCVCLLFEWKSKTIIIL